MSGIDAAQIRKAADILAEAFRNGNQVIFCGNGGSSADAQHIAAEFSGRYMMERPALPGVCLSNIAPVTAIGNDYSYDIVFKRQVEGILRKGDVLVGLSTSGNSKNVILAMEEAKARGGVTVVFTGDGGRMREIADHAVVIPTRETPHVQEGYLCACHIVAGLVEKELFGNRAVFIDRDDTVAPDVPYCDDPAKFGVFPDVPGAIARLNAAGYLVILITNQSGINRGYFDEETLESIHAKLRAQVEAGGGRIDDIFYCPHTPEERCSCRKPEIGMGVAAIRKHGINPRASWMVGDHDKDVEFGRRLGCRTVKVGPGTSFSDAVDEILRQS
ncbi:MAG: HAD-IIIA family hydrolase [Thermoplasmata archaeon]|nr:HAD-IIIA family hydrolase [Thermoplasmata archaeon]